MYLDGGEKGLAEGMDKILKCPIFIAVITSKFVKDEESYHICSYANSLGKIMYAVVKRGTRWDSFKHFDWRKVYYFKNSDEFPEIIGDIKRDFNFLKAVMRYEN